MATFKRWGSEPGLSAHSAYSQEARRRVQERIDLWGEYRSAPTYTTAISSAISSSSAGSVARDASRHQLDRASTDTDDPQPVERAARTRRVRAKPAESQKRRRGTAPKRKPWTNRVRRRITESSRCHYGVEGWGKSGTLNHKKIQIKKRWIRNCQRKIR